jgi:hypothetical protein
MRTAVVIALLASCATDLAVHASEQKPIQTERFVVEGLFAIDVPVKGYTLTELEVPVAQQGKARVFLLRKEDSPTVAVISAELRAAQGQRGRVATVKAHYNGAMERMKNDGYSNLKSSVPSVEPPIPDYVQFVATAAKPDGSPFFLHSGSRFGRNIYLVQTVSNSLAEVKLMSHVAASLQEP